MSMVILKRFLDASEAESATRNGISQLLDAAVEHAVQVDAEEHENLRKDVYKLREITGSGTECTLQDLLVNVGTAAHAIDIGRVDEVHTGVDRRM